MAFSEIKTTNSTFHNLTGDWREANSWMIASLGDFFFPKGELSAPSAVFTSTWPRSNTAAPLVSPPNNSHTPFEYMKDCEYTLTVRSDPPERTQSLLVHRCVTAEQLRAMTHSLFRETRLDNWWPP